MANDTIRISTADLRRRLLMSSAPVATLPELSTPSLTGLLRPTSVARLVMPLAQNIPEVPMPEDLLSQFDTPTDHVQPDPVGSQGAPASGLTPPDLARPIGRSSLFHPRSVLPHRPQDQMTTRHAEPNPTYDITTEQFRHEADQLRRENQQLQSVIEEMRQLLQDASEQEQRVQAELGDRDARLVTVQDRVTELEALLNTKPKTKTELEEWADDLERESFQIAQERRTMEQDRKQLREDEESLERQMRDMEVQMARDRAILARQEQELKRLNAEIQHELEVMQRGDGTLRDRMVMFQRRHAEVVSAPSNGPPFGGGFPVALTSTATTTTPPPKKSDTTGLLRKFFRGE